MRTLSYKYRKSLLFFCIKFFEVGDHVFKLLNHSREFFHEICNMDKSTNYLGNDVNKDVFDDVDTKKTAFSISKLTQRGYDLLR